MIAQEIALQSLIRPLDGFQSVDDPMHLLAAFRKRFHALPWAATSSDTLIAPVWSPVELVSRYESQLVSLYTVHLKVIDEFTQGRHACDRKEECARLYQRIRAYCVDWPILGDRLPSPVEMQDPIAAQMLLYGRPDVVMAEDGPKVVETNFDTAIAGFDKPDDLWTIAADVFQLDNAYLTTGRPIPGLAQYFSDLSAGEPLRIHWMMKNDEADRKEYDRLLATLAPFAGNVRHSVHYAGEPIPDDDGGDALLHRSCAIYTVNRQRDLFARTFEQLAPRIRGCTVPTGLSHIESKVFLAWLSHPPCRPQTLTMREKEAIEALLPWTRLLGHLHDDELRRVKQHRDDFILKKTDSYQALDVFFGCNLSQEEWVRLIDAKLGEADFDGAVPNVWIVQERVRPKEYSLLEYTDVGIVERKTGLSCCPYILGGRIRGLETWVTPFTPNHEMINRMQFVPHFIRHGS